MRNLRLKSNLSATIGAIVCVGISFQAIAGHVPLAELQGDITFPGLENISPLPEIDKHQILFKAGFSVFSHETTTNNYVYSLNPDQDISVRLRTYFRPPYNTRLSFNQHPVSVGSAPGPYIYDIVQPVGALHGRFVTQGTWGLSEASRISTSWTSVGQEAFTDVNQDTGDFDLVLGVSDWDWYALNTSFYFPAPVNSQEQSLWSGTNKFILLNPDYRYSTSVIQGQQNTLAADIELVTSDTLVTLALPPEAGAATISRVLLRGSTKLQNNDGEPTNVDLAKIDMNLSLFITSSNQLTLTIRGIAGDYNNVSATITDSLGIIHRLTFDLTLGQPVDTPIGDLDPIIFSENSLDFESVDVGGQTTFNELTTGPEPDDGFMLATGDGDNAQYFDISTSAVFSGNVEVCVTYDEPAEGSGIDEATYRMGHYVCDANNQNCQWQDITTSIDTEANLLCGSTDSFSIFAILQSLDADFDGIPDGADNCPETPQDPTLVNDDGCTSEQLFDFVCPADALYRNHGEYISCIAKEANQQVTDGLLPANNKGDAISDAAKR